MVNITEEKKDYYLTKIRLIEAFIAASDDPKQKEIYEGYRQTFLDKLSKKDLAAVVEELVVDIPVPVELDEDPKVEILKKIADLKSKIE